LEYEIKYYREKNRSNENKMEMEIKVVIYSFIQRCFINFNKNCQTKIRKTNKRRTLFYR
jgi:hypothetical protein